jgi:urease accessory protein
MLQAAQREMTAPRVSGKLRLAFERGEDGATILASAQQRAPLRVVRAFPLAGGGALVHLHNVSGGVLGGDRLELEIVVGAGAWAQVTTTGATRVYRTLDSAATPIETRDLRVAAGALLELLPDPLIPFAGARYRQETRVELEAGAGLFWWETVAPGRTARGEVFAYDALDLTVEIRAAGRPAAFERARLEPARRPLDAPGRFGPYRYLATFYACRAAVVDTVWRGLETEMAYVADRLSGGGMVWGVSTLASSGVVARGLAVDGSGLPRALFELWRAAKRSLYGAEAAAPRKIY